MRKALNNNPLVAVGVLGVMGLVVAFMLMHSVSSRSSGSSTTSTTATTATSSTGATVDPAVGTPATATPATATSAAPAAAVGQFKAGPGLPKAVVDAYDSGKVVAIVVLKRSGIEDQDVARATAPLRNSSNVAFFPTLATKVARYSRITEGVDLNRVPAIVIIRPKNRTDGPTPQATVDYGFKSIQSVAQAVRDATYKGAENLPSFPR